MNLFKNTKKDIPFEIKKIGKKKKGSKLKTTAISISIFIVLISLLTSAYGVFSFFTTYGVQSPVILRSPIYPLKHEVILSPISKGTGKESYIFDIGKIADKIYALESSSGKNDGCRNLGLYNGYGFRQNSNEWICYSSHEQVRSLVIDWLTTHIKNGDIESALCLYNRGIKQQGCTYAINYKSL